MNKSIGLLALPIALVLSAGALANDQSSSMQNGTPGEAIETLKSSLSSTNGFQVEDVRAGDDGVACITYSISNDQGGKSRSHAVVEGDKVLRETTGNTRFQKAWNSKCVAAR